MLRPNRVLTLKDRVMFMWSWWARLKWVIAQPMCHSLSVLEEEEVPQHDSMPSKWCTHSSGASKLSITVQFQTMYTHLWGQWSRETRCPLDSRGSSNSRKSNKYTSEHWDFPIYLNRIFKDPGVIWAVADCIPLCWSSSMPSTGEVHGL